VVEELPETRAPTATGFFASADGTQLYYEYFCPASDPIARVVIVHGYDDHAGRYRDLALRLADEGFSAMAFDYRGHGRAAGRRGHCVRFHEYLADLEAAVGQTPSVDRANGQPVEAGAGDGPTATHPMVILAHSHGALIALHWLCQDWPKATNDNQDAATAGSPASLVGGTAVDAAVLSSPYLGPGFHLAWYEKLALALASPVVPTLTVPNRLQPQDMTHDPHRLAAREPDPLVHGVATVRWCTESARAQHELAGLIERLAVPSLWLVGGADRVADPATTLSRYEAVRAEKELHVYDQLYHELFNEVERERVIADLLAWLRARYSS
jgi:alpha-beta hydrolase superfamily lysophospholipase